MLNVKIKKLSDFAKTPKKMTAHAAGYDLFSANTEPITVYSGSLSLIPTGIAIEIPKGYEAQIRPRSGLALKYQIGVLNSPGTIDADYRGEIKVILYNFGKKDFVVQPASRIAQIIFAKVETANFIDSENLSETERDSGGFGHTEH